MSDYHYEPTQTRMVFADALMNIRTVEFGRRVKAARVAGFLTQIDVAAAVGVTSSYISRIESGDRESSFAVRLAIADAIGVSVGSLVGLELSGESMAEPIEVALPRLLREMAALPDGRRLKLEAVVMTHAALIATRLAEVTEVEDEESDAS